jgi:hypothetical protein
VDLVGVLADEVTGPAKDGGPLLERRGRPSRLRRCGAGRCLGDVVRVRQAERTEVLAGGRFDDSLLAAVRRTPAVTRDHSVPSSTVEQRHGPSP